MTVYSFLASSLNLDRANLQKFLDYRWGRDRRRAAGLDRVRRERPAHAGGGEAGVGRLGRVGEVHDPGHHDTRAHLGVRTATHKLIHFWKKDQWELFDLRADPAELRNLYGQPGQEAVTAELEATLARLRAELQDDDRFADEQPPAGVDGSVATLRGK